MKIISPTYLSIRPSIHPSIYPSLKSINQIKSNQPGSNPSRSVEKKNCILGSPFTSFTGTVACCLPMRPKAALFASRPASQPVSLFIHITQLDALPAAAAVSSVQAAGLLGCRRAGDEICRVWSCSVLRCGVVWLESSCRHAGETCMCMC